MKRLTSWLALAAASLVTEGVRAAPEPPNPLAYAVVVGSNPGGAGQEALHFAEADAKRIREVLTELGHYAPGNVKLLVRPSPGQVLGTLSELRARLEEHRARGEEATLFFFYSGHARANAMNLGDEPLELRELRTRLSELPTALTIVVLDACQSGTFSRIKGASKAADFSYNSVASLQTRGLAVMASSSSTELSQESDHLGSSYFTHYLLVGLRGAGDQNRDGRVSLDEAYRYAYGQTLAATTRTAVGGQHVTLETELTGQGDVPMTYPAGSTSQFVLPKEFGGQVLLQNKSHHAVVAELTKAPGAPISLAVPPTDYSVVVRQDRKVWDCPVSLAQNQIATLDLGACTPAVDEGGLAKGTGTDPRWTVADHADDEPHREKAPPLAWGFEGGLGFASAERNDAYVQQLHEFGYQKATYFLHISTPRWSLGVTRGIARNVTLLARVRNLDSQSFDRGFLTGDDKSFSWDTYGLSLGVRGNLDLAGDVLSAYGQVELGGALGSTFYFDGNSTPSVETSETYLGFQGAAAVGLQVFPWRQVGFTFETAYAYAPVVRNLLGDTHDSGGLSFLFGLRVQTWRFR